jgi:phosphate transport system substrate-binding protein
MRRRPNILGVWLGVVAAVTIVLLGAITPAAAQDPPPPATMPAGSAQAATQPTTEPGMDLVTGDDDVVDDAIPPYHATGPAKGTIRAVGGTTSAMLLNRAADAFRQIEPEFRAEFTAGGSSTGPPALLAGTSSMITMARPLSDDEIAAFTAKYHYAPTAVPIAEGAITIFVHHDNPVPALSLAQLRQIFTRERQPDGRVVDDWGELGLGGEWSDRPISLYRMDDRRGETSIFRERALGGAGYSASAEEELTASSAVQAVAVDRSGITFAPTFFRCREVRMVPLIGADGQPYLPSGPNCRDRRYPMARQFYIYLNKPPGKAVDTTTAEFLRFVLSRDGQQTMIESGVFALSKSEIDRGLLALSP